PGMMTLATVDAPAEGDWQSVYWQITNGAFVGGYPMYGETTTTNGRTVTYRATGTGPVTLTAQGYDTFGCISPDGTKQVALRSVAAPVIQTEVNSICPGMMTLATVDAPAEGDWQSVYWQITNGVFVGGYPMYGETTTTNGRTVTYRATGTGAVTLTAQGYDTFGCISPDGTKQVAIRTVAAPVIRTEVDATCPGTTVLATVDAPAEGDWQQVYWTITNGVFSMGGPGNWTESDTVSGRNVAFRANGNGPVTLAAHGFDTFGCVSPDGTKQIAIRTVAAPVIRTEVDTTCPGTTVLSTVDAPAEGDWQNVTWTITNGVFSVGGPGDWSESN